MLTLLFITFINYICTYIIVKILLQVSYSMIPITWYFHQLKIISLLRPLGRVGQLIQEALNLLACWITLYIVVVIQCLMRNKNLKFHLISLKISKTRSMFYQSHFHSTQLIFSNFYRYSAPTLNAKKLGVTLRAIPEPLAQH